MKRTIIVAIAIMAMVAALCIFAGAAVAEDSYDLTGTWVGTFDNGAVGVGPAPMSWSVNDAGGTGVPQLGDVTGEVYQTTGYDDALGDFNVEVNYQEDGLGSCEFIEVGANELQYQSKMLIQGRVLALNPNHSSYLLMTTNDADHPDDTLSITDVGGTLHLDGTV